MAPKLVSGSDPSAGAKYPLVTVDENTVIEIFPPLGIARLGNSETEYFLAPEVIGQTDPPTSDKNFRDGQGNIRRQAVRFRAYAYDAAGTFLGEVNSNNGFKLTWTVHVANRKASFSGFKTRDAGDLQRILTDSTSEVVGTNMRNKNVKENRQRLLVIDPERQNIASDQTAPVELKGKYSASNPAIDVYLGELHVDDAGRLIFLGGRGRSQSVGGQETLSETFDNDGWIDDTCDGYVKVTVSAANFKKDSAHNAWVASAPPKFVWGIRAPTTLYDIMENVYHNAGGNESVEFYRDIWPVLLAAVEVSWVNNTANDGHGAHKEEGYFLTMMDKLSNKDPTDPNKADRQKIFGRLRKPDSANKKYASKWYMPFLSGDNGLAPLEEGQRTDDPKRFAALTQLQYDRFESWKDGRFTVMQPEFPTNLEAVHGPHQPRHLTRAALEQTIGDPLYPGIEGWWIAKEKNMYDLTVKHLDPPFRVGNIEPGCFTGGLALPWQGDFQECKTLWWPSVRPDVVVTMENFNEVMKGPGQPNENLSKLERTDWGIVDNGTDGDRERARTAMVRNWNFFGFVKRIPLFTAFSAYVESESRASEIRT